MGERLEDADLGRREPAARGTCHADRADALALDEQRHDHAAAIADGAGELAREGIGVRVGIGVAEVDDRRVEDDAPGETVRVERARVRPDPARHRFPRARVRRGEVVRHQVHASPVGDEDVGEDGVAQPQRARHDRVEHRLGIVAHAADERDDLARCGLPVPLLRELGREPRVIEGEGRVGRERAQLGHLRRGETPPAGTPERDHRADGARAAVRYSAGDETLRSAARRGVHVPARSRRADHEVADAAVGGGPVTRHEPRAAVGDPEDERIRRARDPGGGARERVELQGRGRGVSSRRVGRQCGERTICGPENRGVDVSRRTPGPSDGVYARMDCWNVKKSWGS